MSTNNDNATRTPEIDTVRPEQNISNPMVRESKQLCGLEDELSGYGTDASLGNSSSYPENNTSTSDDSTSEGGALLAYAYDSEESEEEEIGVRIDYLNQKQSLLARASCVFSSEEHYNAATARSTMYGGTTNCLTSSPPSALWKEALEVLRELGEREEVTKQSVCSNDNHQTIASRKRKSPKDPKIDMSGVENLPSLVFATRQEQIVTGDGGNWDLLTSLPSCIFHKGQWMAQALVWSAPVPVVEQNHQNKQDLEHMFEYRWKMNPSTHALSLLPPNGILMEHSVDIQEALSFSTDARVVTQATPPFSIVFANRAFFELVGFGPDNSSAIIGRPIESIMQVDRGGQSWPPRSDQSPNSNNNDNKQDVTTHYLRGRFSQGDSTKVYRVRVSPIIDRARRQRLEPNPSSNTRDYSCMSHILIQVYGNGVDDGDNNNDDFTTSTTLTTAGPSQSGKGEQDSSSSKASVGLGDSPSNEAILGMVG